MAQDDWPSGSGWCSVCVRVALPVGHAGVDIGQGGVEMLVGQPGPCLGRLPRHNGLNLITGRVLRGAVAESDPDKLEPCRVLRRRGDVNLAAVQADIKGAALKRDVEGRGLVLRHPCEGVEQPSGSTSRARTSAGVSL